VHRFTAPDGIQIAYGAWGRDCDRPPVILHHGFVADSHLNWVVPGVVDALVAAGRRVFALDARGHGRSDKPRDPAAYGEAAMARDLVRLADELGVRRYDLVGYSMGAIVALIAASRDPRVRRLVVGGVGAAVVELGGVDTRALPTRALVAALEADDPSSIEDPGAARFRSFADAVGADREALAAHARVVHASPIELDRIAAPTLVLAGKDDDLAARPEVLVDAIPAAILRPLAGDHLTAISDPDFAAAIVAFVA
jgi:pimeloyl-ACP methyl ester carboxylesterase